MTAEIHEAKRIAFVDGRGSPAFSGQDDPLSSDASNGNEEVAT